MYTMLGLLYRFVVTRYTVYTSRQSPDMTYFESGVKEASKVRWLLFTCPYREEEKIYLNCAVIITYQKHIHYNKSVPQANL